MRTKLLELPDSISPDEAICEHCAQKIWWDEICYVHRNGFAECGLIVGGGVQGGGFEVDPEFRYTRENLTHAEPTTWFVDVV